MLLGTKRLPNLAGFEYYKGGIFEIEPPKPKTQTLSQTTSNFPPSFDWRNRHGKNWMTEVRNQHIPNPCGSCWAHATVGAIEGVINLYFNQKLDLDISEQELLSCSRGGDCGGGDPNIALSYFYQNGLATEECIPYKGLVEECKKCGEYEKKLVKHSGKEPRIISNIYSAGDEGLKKLLITNGPLITDEVYLLYPDLKFPEGLHVMVLVGYDTCPISGNNVFIFKNSWGKEWGENGYLKIFVDRVTVIPVEPPFEISFAPNLKINCEDRDNDGYCNWGISKDKPDTCPAFCKPEKDCDDSNPNLGPFNSNYNCQENPPLLQDNIPPSIGTLNFYKVALYMIKFEVNVSDNQEVNNCVLLINGKERTPLNLSQVPCKNCNAFIFYDFLSPGIFKVRTRCWDKSGNVAEGEEAEVILSQESEDKNPPMVDKVTPNIAGMGVSQIFSVKVSDDTGVASCDFYINENYIGKMELSQPYCLQCTASISYTFNEEGVYSSYAICQDSSGKTGRGEKTEIFVSKKALCPPLSFPKDYWETVWYERETEDCIGKGQNIQSLTFDMNWGQGTLIRDKKDNLILKLSRTIELEEGKYKFIVGSDDGVKVFIDGELCFNQWKDRPYTIDSFEKDLSGGAHQIEIHYYENKGAARLSFNFEKISQIVSTPTPTQTPTPTPTKSPSPSCINECSYLDQREYRCLGNILQKRVCGNFDLDSCLEWSDWFEEKNCDSMDKCIDTTYYDYFCSQNNCTFNPYPNDPRCTQQPSWLPCDPTSGWQCGESKGGSEPYCSGTPIGWGRGREGIVYCEGGEVAIEGKCEGKNDDKVVKNEEVLHLFPYPSVLTQSEVKFKPKGGWYCKFRCSGFLCGSDGCGWVKCQKTQKDIAKIELKIFDWLGKIIGQPLYQTTVYQQNEIVWNGTNNKGEKLPNGTYYFEAKIYLKDQRVFTNEGEIQIKRQ